MPRLSSSETLYDFQRETIEESFECRVYDYFGAAERVMFATECDVHQGRHVCSEYGITEIVGRDLEPQGTRGNRRHGRHVFAQSGDAAVSVCDE